MVKFPKNPKKALEPPNPWIASPGGENPTLRRWWTQGDPGRAGESWGDLGRPGESWGELGRPGTPGGVY